MMADMFTVFDYQAYVSLHSGLRAMIFWAFSLSCPTMLYSTGCWVRGSTLWHMLMWPLSCWAWEETLAKVKDVGSAMLVMSACLWVTMVVLWQAVPGVFVSVSHLSVTGAVALPLWSGMVLASSLTSTNEFLASLVPSGCPWYLGPALVVVEVFSHLMRPVALCARLSLTMMTGHILLGLVWGLSSELLFSLEAAEGSALVGPVVALVDVFLGLVEVGIGFLQSYIMFTLLLFFSTQYPRVDGRLQSSTSSSEMNISWSSCDVVAEERKEFTYDPNWLHPMYPWH